MNIPSPWELGLEVELGWEEVPQLKRPHGEALSTQEIFLLMDFVYDG